MNNDEDAEMEELGGNMDLDENNDGDADEVMEDHHQRPQQQPVDAGALYDQEYPALLLDAQMAEESNMSAEDEQQQPQQQRGLRLEQMNVREDEQGDMNVLQEPLNNEQDREINDNLQQDGQEIDENVNALHIDDHEEQQGIGENNGDQDNHEIPANEDHHIDEDNPEPAEIQDPNLLEDPDEVVDPVEIDPDLVEVEEEPVEYRAMGGMAQRRRPYAYFFMSRDDSDESLDDDQNSNAADAPIERFDITLPGQHLYLAGLDNDDGSGDSDEDANPPQPPPAADGGHPPPQPPLEVNIEEEEDEEEDDRPPPIIIRNPRNNQALRISPPYLHQRHLEPRPATSNQSSMSNASTSAGSSVEDNISASDPTASLFRGYEEEPGGRGDGRTSHCPPLPVRTIRLPVLEYSEEHNSLLVMPGVKLPLRLSSPRSQSIMSAAMRTPHRAFVCIDLRQHGPAYGCILQIQDCRRVGETLHVIANATQRYKLVDVHTEVTGVVMAEIECLHETFIASPLASIRLASAQRHLLLPHQQMLLQRCRGATAAAASGGSTATGGNSNTAAGTSSNSNTSTTSNSTDSNTAASREATDSDDSSTGNSSARGGGGPTVGGGAAPGGGAAALIAGGGAGVSCACCAGAGAEYTDAQGADGASGAASSSTGANANGKDKVKSKVSLLVQKGCGCIRSLVSRSSCGGSNLSSCRQDSIRHQRSLRDKRGRMQRATSVLTRHPYWVYQQCDVYQLAARIRPYLLSMLREGANTAQIPSSPVELCRYTCINLPLHDRDRRHLLHLHGYHQRLHYLLGRLQKMRELRCLQCSAVLTEHGHIIIISEEGSQSAFVNPGGYVHEMITVSYAANLELMGRPTREHSWFPGYAWTIASCRTCHHHIGWKFTATRPSLRPRKFYGLTRGALEN